MNTFTIITADGFIWNYSELLKFLVDNQGQDITIDTNGEGCCSASNGTYKILEPFKFKSVTIKTNNVVEYHPSYNIDIGQSSFRFFELATGDYSAYHQWNQRKIFGSLYNRAIWHRTGLASHMAKYHRDITALNFRSNPHTEEGRELFELQGLFERVPATARDFLEVADQFPVQLEAVDGYTVGETTTVHTDQLCEFYKDFLVDIVAETFTSGRTFFATEKTVRPMLLKKPFIHMGPKCFLIHLRQMGFKTFHDFWDEEYDGYDGALRFTHILKLVDNISQKSKEELQDMYNCMKPILDHNHNLLMSQQYNRAINYVE